MSYQVTVSDVKWARRLLWRMARRYRHLREDIESEGLLGLAQAARSFREGGVTFRFFAGPRVLGAASDWLRLQSLRVSARTSQKRMGSEVGGWDCDTFIADETTRPEDAIDERRRRAWLSRTVAELRDRRSASMLSMRIYGEKTLKDIGRAYGLSEASACLITGAAIRALTKGADL